MGVRVHPGLGATVAQPTAAYTWLSDVVRTSVDYWSAVFSGDRNLRDGTYTEEGKAKIIEASVPAVVQASGGTMSEQQARDVLRKDVTQVLKDAKADPSQTGTLGLDIFPPWVKWAAIGGGGLLLLAVLRR